MFDTFGVETLIRLDVRSDEDGNMFILKANPKPDLKASEPGQTSLVSIGLADHGMSYDDLILSILANRVDRLIAEGHPLIDRLADIS